MSKTYRRGFASITCCGYNIPGLEKFHKRYAHRRARRAWRSRKEIKNRKVWGNRWWWSKDGKQTITEQHGQKINPYRKEFQR